MLAHARAAAGRRRCRSTKRTAACWPHDLTALRTQPPADVSAMDGYAVRASDVAKAPVHLKVIGEVAAGRPFAATVKPGEAARIFTGGVMPDGADTVVIQEHTTRDGDRVDHPEADRPRAAMCARKGIDFTPGERAACARAVG